MNRKQRWAISAISLLFLFAATILFFEPASCLAGSNKINWNGRSIQWYGYQNGLNYAKRSKKPVIMIFYADWCPACRKYSSVFQDSRVVQQSLRFVMIRVNIDRYPKISARYGFDGQYVPRTIVLAPSGQVMHDIYPDKAHKYSIGSSPDRLLALMEKAYAGI